MKMIKTLVLVLTFVFYGFILITNCEPTEVEYKLCNGTTMERSQNSTVHNVTLDPCSTTTNGACDIIAGDNATVVVDFAPDEKLGTQTRHGIYWETAVQMELRGLPKKACRTFVDCSADAGVRRSYRAVIPLQRTFPKRAYDVKLKLYSGNRKVYMCVVIPVHLK